MINKFEEYKNRQRDWRDISVTQLSNTNNILLSLSSALLAISIGKNRITKINIDLSQSVNFEIITYLISVFFLSISIFFGIAVLFARLYDFRISKHIALVRKRYYFENKDILERKVSDKDFGNFNYIDRIKVLNKIIFCRLPFLTLEESKKISKDKKIEDKFQDLRRTAKILGSSSWRWTKIQVGLFLLSGIVYLIHNFPIQFS